MGNHPSVAGAAPPALVWGLDGEEELAAAAAAAAAASAAAGGSGSAVTEAGPGGSAGSGSGSGSRHEAAGLDFGALFVEGEPWAEAQQRAAFLARVQRRLLDPAFVAALQLEEGGGQGGHGCRRGEEVRTGVGLLGL